MKTKLSFEFTLDKHVSLQEPLLKLELDQNQDPKSKPDVVNVDMKLSMKPEIKKVRWEGECDVEPEITAGMKVHLDFTATDRATWHLTVSAERGDVKYKPYDHGAEVSDGPRQISVEFMR